jgi:hypothetical protein
MGASVAFFLVMLVIVILLSKSMTRNRLREMQQPNIVYFLKKKVLQYLKGEPDEEPLTRMPPPPPPRRDSFNYPPPPPRPPVSYRDYPPPSRFEEPPGRYGPLPEEQKPYDHLVIPPPMPVDDRFEESFKPEINNSRAPTNNEGRPLQYSGEPDYSGNGGDANSADLTNAPAGPSIEKPKVQIKPYKFTFD